MVYVIVISMKKIWNNFKIILVILALFFLLIVGIMVTFPQEDKTNKSQKNNLKNESYTLLDLFSGKYLALNLLPITISEIMENENSVYIKCDHEIMKLKAGKNIPEIFKTVTYFLFNGDFNIFYILASDDSYLIGSNITNEKSNEIFIDENFAKIIREDLSIQYNREKQEINILYYKVYDEFDLDMFILNNDFEKEEIKSHKFLNTVQTNGTCKTILYDDLSREAKRESDILQGIKTRADPW